MNKQEIENAIKVLASFDRTEDIELRDAVEIAVPILEKQLNNGWIPVSERLPNEEECNLYDVMHPCHRQFICTVKVENYEPQTRQLFFSDIFGWKYGLGDYNEYVMAWQPPPSVWKGENNG